MGDMLTELPMPLKHALRLIHSSASPLRLHLADGAQRAEAEMQHIDAIEAIHRLMVLHGPANVLRWARLAALSYDVREDGE